jgi:hypothetical protein
VVERDISARFSQSQGLCDHEKLVCLYPGCDDFFQETFDTLMLHYLTAHPEARHGSKFCSRKGCKYHEDSPNSKPFVRHSDLVRHYKTVHCKAGLEFCPVKECKHYKDVENAKPFRADKLQEHMKKMHKDYNF